MFKTRFISMLVLLAAVATGAWADTTVTWTASDMSGIYIDFLDGEAYNNTIKGITVTSSGGGGAGASWESTDIQNSGSTTITFTSSVGNIKSIAITAEDIEMSSIPSGWTTDYSTLSWSGVASSTVSLPLSGGTDISEISGIVFTIEPPTVAVTGVTLAPTSATLTLGETETVTLIPTVLPGDATDKSVTWSSSNEAVATVTDGVVTAVAAGTATITVTTTDGAKTATCAVTVAAPAASTYTVTLKEGTEDATSWTIAPAEATTTGVEAGTEVKATYGGMKKVKSVKAVKKAKPAATVTTAPTAKTGVKAGEDVAIVNEGAAEGGTMMYMVNATQPASTDGFSATVPTAEGLTAGTYYVWYYVKADDSHTDSEISASGIEVTIAAATPTLSLTSPAVGQVIGDDGKNYDYASLPGGVTAVAKICYVSGSNGLALALADEGQMNWSTAISTCAAHTPAFTGGTWKLATQDEWNNMISGAGSYTALRDGFTSVGGSNLESDLYWSSSERNASLARYYSFFNGSWSITNKDSDNQVRACLAF